MCFRAIRLLFYFNYYQQVKFEMFPETMIKLAVYMTTKDNKKYNKKYSKMH